MNTSISTPAEAASARAPHPVVAPEQWLAERRALLQEEKELTRAHDRLAARRRAMPWVRLEKSYRFEGPRGQLTLADLFGRRSQLVIYHFMFGPGWAQGCKSCSFVSDHLNAAVMHLQGRDVAFAAVSHAPLAEFAPFKARMGWTFPWVSAHGSDFNVDFHVSFSAAEVARGEVYYNYGLRPFPVEEGPGLSVFAKDHAGVVYHTYSTYGRGLDRFIGTYQLLDLTPHGRDEADDAPMSWVRHHDRYEPESVGRESTWATGT